MKKNITPKSSLEIGSLVRHKSSGSIGIVVYVSPTPEAVHHIEVWICDDNSTRWWSHEFCEVICK